MEKIYVGVNEDILGSYLGEDVYSVGGNMIVPSNTIITDYILKKLVDFRIDKIFIYNSNPVHGDEYLSNEKLNQDQKKYIEDVNVAKQMLQDLASGKKLDFSKAEDISEHIYSKINDCGSLMDCVNSVRIADSYTYSHLVNVSVYSMLLGKWLGFGKKQLKEIVMAGLLHDVGKARIPEEILNKKGALTDCEYEIMKRHTVYGYEIVKGIKGISMDIKRAVIMHHEKEDGTGYPFGIKGSQKNLYSKIVTVSDIFDAITSERVYRGRQTPFTAFKELENVGFETVDPKIMMALFTNMPSYYVGSKVKLKNGEIGEVVYVPNQCAYAPVIRVNEDFVDFSKEKEELIKEFL
ncbi:HD-GYP domain-containing protein [Ruminiclostridium cellobioparum]|uniref:HD-GYP domain-containing protein n=1 Tax=Ruminiclostridium cellobioparum subsp. termitidis CT1112 TaxID=1195236 RepID=S0FNZ1_RUMCE|nr:HD-GYP domain-containing protein [Ruminiclostridium cellobioparum]EMS73940.1 HD-GYP domain-containing protein [Ruminiclostridium cellobioparum subsp. termitidis CT1112]